MHAVRAEPAPTIDGNLSDPVWQKARWDSDFRQQQPVENGEPTVKTEVAIAFDSDAIYFAARMYRAPGSPIAAPLTRNDDTGDAERIIFSIDTYKDRRTAYSFAVTAAGVRADWLHPNDTTFPRDKSFDPVWNVEVKRSRDRWTAELRIPLSQLRFNDDGDYRWGININRFLPKNNEDIFWIVVPKDDPAWASKFGTIAGIDNIGPVRRIELLPYVAADLTVTSDTLFDPNDPFADATDFGGRAGIDAKFGIGPNLILNATINPDFGQVEADPATVNLTAFETIFEERRPFFTEGNQLFEVAGPRLFYSRRIGAPPRGSISGDYTEVPQFTSILGAAKLTGRVGRTSIAALTALTGPEDGKSFDVATGETTTAKVEPLTSFSALRASREFGKSSSKVGALVTGVFRAFGDEGNLRDELTRDAVTAALDWDLLLADGKYELYGSLSVSSVGGSADAIAALQQSNVHLFQRPDQSHVSYDPTRERLTGNAGQLVLGRRSGSVRWNAGTFFESPDFDVNDVGLLFSGDDIGAFTSVSYIDTVAGTQLHQWDVSIGADQELNFGGDPEPSGGVFLAGVTFTNFWRLALRTDTRVPGKSDALTRGGPLMGTGWANQGELSLSNAFAAATRFNFALGWFGAQTGLTGSQASAEITWRPLDSLQLVLAPRVFIGADNRQFVDIIEGAGGPTFDTRYLFATVHRQDVSVQARAQLAFSPDLSIELYAQPFASSVEFTRFGELPEPGSRELRRYSDSASIIEQDGVFTVTDGADSFSFSDPSFAFISFRSTVVLRWQFLPGSTLFAVWQQNRAEVPAQLDRASPGDLATSVTSPGSHTFALKLSYWWPYE